MPWWIDWWIVFSLAELTKAHYQGVMDQVLTLSAIRERKVALSQSILDAQKQLADLEVAERIVRRFGTEAPDEAAEPASADLLTSLKTVRVAVIGSAAPLAEQAQIQRTLTTRALILSILRRSEGLWMTANEIQDQAEAVKGRLVPMATISPTLSSFKNEGLIVRDGFKVALAERLNENEAPADKSEDASETALPAQ